ncbi:hypothetical protein [uncultured Lacinutrix sp.]|uniref:hypothetical protein n=1 Tax=uncultured Lacinutrix sp. TaxID=574032 RepID=UPI0026338B74|nr:hypothetical protein [uncultured Lacinutrix sp.]
MNTIEFTNILQEPQVISSAQTDALKTIINAFPYFQSARAMYLKGLKNSDSFKYNYALKTTAAYTTDRSILFDFITSSNFEQNEVSKFIKQNSAHLNDIEVIAEDISLNKNIIIDNTLKQDIENVRASLDPELFQPKIAKEQLANFEKETTHTIIESEKTESKETLAPEVVLNLGKPLLFDKTETHSFNEWLNLTRFKPINRNDETVENSSKDIKASKDSLSKAKKFELIEKFIEKNPKLEGKKPASSTHNIAKAQMIQPEALMTETLARIYVEQKNYKKAIQSYNILSLKYPEKSGFFADQIKAVKKLQEHNNKE